MLVKQKENRIINQINKPKTEENSNTGDFPKSKDEYLKGRAVNKNYSSNFFRKYVLYYSIVQNTALFSVFNFEYSTSSILFFFLLKIFIHPIYSNYDFFTQLFQFLPPPFHLDIHPLCPSLKNKKASKE